MYIPYFIQGLCEGLGAGLTRLQESSWVYVSRTVYRLPLAQPVLLDGGGRERQVDAGGGKP